MITPEQLSKSGTESGHQSAFFCWCAQSGIDELKWCFAIPNGGLRNPATAGRLKAEGVKSGVSDICLPVIGGERYIEPETIASYKYYGLFIEMKREQYRNNKNGGLLDEQKEFGEFVTGQGYKFVICYSWIEARDAVLSYLGKKNINVQL